MTTDNVAEMTPEQLHDELAATKRVAQVWFRKATGCKKELAQTCTDLKDLRGANREYGQQLADMTENREFWYKEAQDAEAEVKQLQADLKLNARMLVDQCDQAREAENEATVLRRQLAEMEAGRDFWRREYGRNTKRLATLDAAEDALAECGSRGIYTDFDDPADAIMQMAARIEKLEDESMIEIEITGQEMVEALQAEHRLRQEAERVCKAMSEMARNRGTRLEEMEQRAECAEAQLSNGHRTLTAAGVPQSDASGKLSITGRVVRLRQRAERAEALAQPVNEEAAELLEKMATENVTVYEKCKVIDLVAQIREALIDEH